jgi:hypothetical protein
MTLEANKALIRRVFEEVIPAGEPAAMRDFVAPDFLDHDPLPGQPAGVESVPGAGTTFRVTLPDREPTPEVASSPPSAP